MPTPVDTRLLGYLGRALSYELSAVTQYLASATLADAWGETEAARRFREEVVEELKHAERLTEALTRLGALPGQAQLAAVRGGRNLMELLGQSARHEEELILLYSEATRYCARMGDVTHQALFQGLLDEEQSHAAELGHWQAELLQPATARPTAPAPSPAGG